MTEALIYLGAIDKNTNKYTSPIIAEKGKEYICPDCNRPVFFRKGNKNKPHFSHYREKSINCVYYNKPTESQIHKDAKMLMKSLLDDRRLLRFNKNCSKCDSSYFENIEYNQNSKAVIDYRYYTN